MGDEPYTSRLDFESFQVLALIFGALWLCTKLKAAAAVANVACAALVLLAVGCMTYLLFEAAITGRWLGAAFLGVATLPYLLALILPAAAAARHLWRQRKTARRKTLPPA